MNMIKLFVLASICFSATSINAMHHQRNVQVKTVDINNLNLCYEEESYFSHLKNMATPTEATITYILDIPFNNYIPSNIEGLSEEKARYFNVLATLELFKRAINNPAQRDIIKKMNLSPFSFDNTPDDDLSHFYQEHLIISAYSEIIDLELTHIERKKIYQMMQRNMDKIIKNLLSIV